MPDRSQQFVVALSRAHRLLGHCHARLILPSLVIGVGFLLAGTQGGVAAALLASLVMFVMFVMAVQGWTRLGNGGTSETTGKAQGPAQMAGVGAQATDFELRSAYLDKTRKLLATCVATKRNTALYVISADHFDAWTERYGQAFCDKIMETMADIVMARLHAHDALASRIGEGRLSMALAPVPQRTADQGGQIAAPVQSRLERPIVVPNPPNCATVSIGFCTVAGKRARGLQDLPEAGNLALKEARHTGHSAIRNFSGELGRTRITRHALLQEARPALENGQICAWFQPRISTDTGEVSGIEAIPRWLHPTRGLLCLSSFLPVLAGTGLKDRLSGAILTHALATLRRLDRDGIVVPTVWMSFSPKALRDPDLVERVLCEIDRHCLTPDRLAVEIPETSASGPLETCLARNIAGLDRMGSLIDLGDLGTGHACLTPLRQFPVRRLRIDRSFVTNCDTDMAQQDMLSAILTLAERLDLDTLAEGIETAGEHAMVSQLGVRHVQGFGIARPMPAGKLADWIRGHRAKLIRPPTIGGATR